MLNGSQATFFLSKLLELPSLEVLYSNKKFSKHVSSIVARSTMQVFGPVDELVYGMEVKGRKSFIFICRALPAAELHSGGRRSRSKKEAHAAAIRFSAKEHLGSCDP
ncbi:unnamed protein product [Cylicostephanus goldi]|uniref:Uncharacterized protein n=1 Tax=Cylicostephanus goldi TaxID=71465 RepID=A0A3P6R020_CYLGO|nr:unnamed protein product [Cylicostephanus goldi]